jgi:lysophospholipase L1-like esterase
MTLSRKNPIHMFLTVLLLVSFIGLPGPITQREGTAQTRQEQVVTEVGRRALSPGTATMPPFALARLEEHKAILNAQGVTNLSGLATLTVSGTVVPQPGFVRAAFVRPRPSLAIATATVRDLVKSSNPTVPEAVRPGAGARQSKPPASASLSTSTQTEPALKPSNMTTAPTKVGITRALSLANTSPLAANAQKNISLPAVKLMGEPFVGLAQKGPRANKAQATVPIHTAYWVANNINLPNNTTIVIQPNVRYLMLIANTITVGANVTFTYEEVPVINAPAVPGKPSAVPGKPGTPNPFTVGYAGSQGYSGTQPLQIGTPPDAPQVEVWTLALSQMPNVILKGQDGHKGVQGGSGGDGGPGGNGSDSNPGTFQCKDGPNNGGVGGKGGRGGDGGQGGNGGTGGRWALYAPTLPTSMTIDVSGGERGDGGDPGGGGNGGPGGWRGSISGFCANQNWSDRHDGSPGSAGDPGVKGPDGVIGPMLPNAINQLVINASDFNNKLNDPAIQHVYPEYPNTASVGSQITVEGLNFTPTDTVTVGGSQAATQFLSNTMLTAIVPNTWGGVAEVKVLRAGNTPVSNTAAIYIKPVVLSTTPPSPTTRLKPGSTVVVNGTGFSKQMSVRVNHEDIATVSPTNSTTLSFVMKRPASIPYDSQNAGGEPAILSVTGSGPIIESNSIAIVIATFQMLVMGDSIMWSEGLQEPDKIHSLVEAYERTLHPGMSVYKSNKAHTGAVLSWNNPISGTAHDGDIPQDYPSIQQQADEFASSPNAATVDLILVSACANDVGFKNFLHPLATQTSIAALVSQYCFGDMTAFLQKTATQFPAAKIIVAGVYQGLSMDTDPGYYVNLAGVFYGLSSNQGLGPSALAAAVGITPVTRLTVTSNAGYFAAQVNIQLANAVNAANSGVSQPRIFFADPQFGPTNAANASNAWVFGLSGGLPNPTDSLASLNRRIGHCASVYNNLSVDYQFCKLASTGHPNETGATKYFDAIKPLL